MDRVEITVRKMLTAIKALFYDVGVLSHRGMLPGLDSIPAQEVLTRLSLLKYRNARGSHIYIRPSGQHRYTVLDDLNETTLSRLLTDRFIPCAVVETSAGNFQAWLKHSSVSPKLVGTFAAQTLASRYDADPSAADWRRFGRLPGFTNCKTKYQRLDGLFPFVRLKSNTGQQYPMADDFAREITTLYAEREAERERKRLQAALSPRNGTTLSTMSLKRFRTSSKYQDQERRGTLGLHHPTTSTTRLSGTRYGRLIQRAGSRPIPTLPTRTSGDRRTLVHANSTLLRVVAVHSRCQAALEPIATAMGCQRSVPQTNNSDPKGLRIWDEALSAILLGVFNRFEDRYKKTKETDELKELAHCMEHKRVLQFRSSSFCDQALLLRIKAFNQRS